MSYQVLARKWRPKTFQEMAGQSHVLRALENALSQGRLHHAYLFTGTRGVGKTTVARILAKSLNCDQGITANPCGQCSACTEIDQGRSVDLIEVDAASRTRVEDTRELLDNVQFAPTQARFKIYLIDEVHMLSVHSFNALLKTLEEPPEHVKFLLATTDPQKLPVTVLSRCLQFSLKNMTPQRIVSHLETILPQESIEFEEAALWEIARAADGSMRDALSLTDQAIAFGNGSLAAEDVQAMLGTVDRQRIVNLLSAIFSQELEAALAEVEQLSEQGSDLSQVLADCVLMLHRIAMAQMVPNAVDNSLGDKAAVDRLAGQVSPQAVQLYYQTALMGRKDLALVPDLRAGLEMVVMRMMMFVPSTHITHVQPSHDSGMGHDSGTGHDVGANSGSLAENNPSSNSEGQKKNLNLMNTASAPAAESAPVGGQRLIQPSQPSQPSQSPQSPQSPQSSQLPQRSEPTPLPSPSAESLMQPVTPQSSRSPASQPQTAAIHPHGSAPVDQAKQRQVVEQPQPLEEQPETSFPTSKAEVASLEEWLKLVQTLGAEGVTYHLVHNSCLVDLNEHQVVIMVDASFEPMMTKSAIDRLESLFQTRLKRPVKLSASVGQLDQMTPAQYLKKVKQQRLEQAEASLMAEPFIQEMMQQFNARLVAGSIELSNK